MGLEPEPIIDPDIIDDTESLQETKTTIGQDNSINLYLFYILIPLTLVFQMILIAVIVLIWLRVKNKKILGKVIPNNTQEKEKPQQARPKIVIEKPDQVLEEKRTYFSRKSEKSANQSRKRR